MDDCLYALQPTIPHLRRSSLHRCLQRHDIARLPEMADEKPKRSRFRTYPIGYFHVDIDVHTEEGRLYLFVGIDRTSKFAFAQLHERATRRVAANFVHALVEAVPYTIHTVLTDNGTQFTDNGPLSGADAALPPDDESVLWGVHAFDKACEDQRIEHRLTKPYHPWTNGQAELMVRTLKEAATQAFRYEHINELRRNVADYLTAYNDAKQLQAVKWKIPYETLQALYQSRAELFRTSPEHFTPGPYT